LFIIFFNLVNIGQNQPGTNNTPTPQSTSSQTSATSSAQHIPLMPTATNIPGVTAGNLDFSNIARSIGTMVQGITGQLIPGATLINPHMTIPTPAASSSSSTTATSNNTSSSQNSNTPTTTNDNETDAMTEQMLSGIIIFENKRIY
jgi:hypothetical protein